MSKRSPAEQAEYQRGYRAGRARTEAERQKWEAAASVRQAQSVMVFSAALIGLLASPRGWSRGNKKYRSVEDFVQGAREFVAIASKEGVI